MQICYENLDKYQLLKKAIDVKQYTSTFDKKYNFIEYRM
jgi:hypothetical protein